jgi:Nif-specific regulatory protein
VSAMPETDAEPRDSHIRTLSGVIRLKDEHRAFQRIVGESPAVLEVRRLLEVAAHAPLPVLFTGESGTGKSTFARALHDASPRGKKPFVEVNCAAIPETLFESELFGAEKGAHSTAMKRVEGKIDAAQGGTLFLDEIGDMPLAVQSKLLMFLQSRRYYRLGSTTPIQADVRVIAATNADLEELVRERRFREDLFYRLNVLGVRVPSLREREADIHLIAASILRAVGDAHGRRIPLSPAAEQAIAEHEWPGNVRQLENALQRGWVHAHAEGAARIEAHHLFATRSVPPPPENETYDEAMRRFQRAFLSQALEQNAWNVTQTAKKLGMARSHLNALIKTHGLCRR